mmetsp:Transcript_44873/g.113589  ORF Transcript_44873/g.113589 Transcript_44873/m.113589 type:complete len:251 (-) Transcript_44873:55-807(-)
MLSSLPGTCPQRAPHARAAVAGRTPPLRGRRSRRRSGAMGNKLGRLAQEAAKLQQQHQQQQAGQQYAAPQPQAGDGVQLVECLFFPDRQMPCRNYAQYGNCRRANCQYAHHATSLTRFLKHFASARRTLDIAMFTITCNEIAAAVEAAHRRGVAVRIVCDDEQMRSNGSDVVALAQKGVPVRCDSERAFHMHHKFAVFDGEMVATGSFNWTRQAVMSNQENVVLLRGAPIASEYCQEFERLWAEFRGNVV